MNVFILVNLLIAIGICLLAFFKLDWRCHLLALISVFQVAIVFEYGSVRVWAYHALAILIMFFVWINFFTQFDTRNKLVFYEMKFVWPIAILIISGSAFLPLVFEGISVYEPSQGMGFDLYPLQWTRSHIAQSGYLIINLSIMFYLACLPNDADFERTICSAFMWMFILAIFFFLWQTVSVLTGFYFPEAFFGGSRGRDYQVYWLEIGRRMNGTFAEPADLGLFSSACLGFGLGLFFYMHKYWIGAFFAVSGCLMAVASGSTTAYLAICAPLCILSFTSLMGRISPMLLIVFVVIGCLALSGLLATDWFWTKWDDVVTNKTETTSYEIRWETV
jgi:hypothetical protein